MKLRAVIAVASLAVFALTQVADARPRARHHAKKSASSGVSMSTSDTNGDGVPDVVTGSKPKSSAYPGTSMKPKDLNGDGIPDAPTAPKSRMRTTTPQPKPPGTPSTGGVYVQ